MFARYPGNKSLGLRNLLCLLMTGSTALAQTQQTPRPQDQGEVVRVYSQLVQTDVMVFDKQGHFVNGLQPENFELRIDGKPRKIEFFEQIKAGSDEESQLSAARGTTGSLTGTDPKRPVPLDRGRTVFFYVDDYHMDLGGLTATRRLISNFIEDDMGQNDEAGIISATGQIGFLQQLTSSKFVLREALTRIKTRQYSVRDLERPPMTEYEALLIERNDTDVFDYFVNEVIRANPGISRDVAAGMVRSRATSIESQAGVFNMDTLDGLERIVRSAKELSGRKVLFFISNGFFVENKHSDSMNKLRQVTSAAAKSGVVIYSLDSRGLVASLTDASSDTSFDPSGRLDRATHDELLAAQDGLNALAQDTGGSAVLNTNDLNQGLTAAIKETSTYYLLAWKPDMDGQKPGRFRSIEVKVVGRPGLSVRVRRGFFDLESPSSAASTANSQADTGKTTATKLRDSILAPFPQHALPISLGVDYYEIEGKGAMVSSAVQIPGEFLMFGPQESKIQALVDLTGVFYNDRGQPSATFIERIVTTAPSLEATQGFHRDITFTYLAKLTPGLYQVRVAARDDKSGRIGSAHAWIQVPDLSNHRLAMSSLLLGEHTQATLTNVSSTGEISPVGLSASHRFRHESNLRLLIFLYNTMLSPTDQKPDAAVQIQVVRDDQPVITTALRKVNSDGVLDLTSLPYAAEIPLSELLPGRYLLQVTSIDRVSKQSASQQTYFEVF